jgi:hypothetical protein
MSIEYGNRYGYAIRNINAALEFRDSTMASCGWRLIRLRCRGRFEGSFRVKSAGPFIDLNYTAE